MKSALFILALLGWLLAIMLVATPGQAQNPPLYVACASVTPSSTGTPYPTITPRATSTTVPLIPSTTTTPTTTLTPFPTELAFITQVDPRNPTIQQASIYQEATTFAAMKTLDAAYNASTAVMQTLYAYYTAQPSATPENAVTVTLQITTYLVVELGGMITRERPDRTSARKDSLYYGDRVSIGQMTQAGGYLWGLTSKGWVAINQTGGAVFLVAQ